MFVYELSGDSQRIDIIYEYILKIELLILVKYSNR